MWLLLTLLGCPKAPPASVLVAEPQVVQFALKSPYGDLAGLSQVTARADGVDMVALTPVGIELFQVHASGEQVEVVAADPEWGSSLARLPWTRDLGLLHQWTCEQEACSTPNGGRLMRRSDTELRYKGPGGPATVLVQGARVEVHDPRRRYTLVVIHGS